MAFKLVGYENKYHDSSIQCLRRNFPALNRLNDDELDSWFDRIVNYHWQDEEGLEKLPYYKGAVLLSQEEVVVGFFGLIYAYRNFSGNRILTMNGTTWAIDQDSNLRFYIIKVMAELYGNVDYVTALTDAPSLRKLNAKMYKMKYFDKCTYCCSKLLVNKGKKLVTVFINKESDIKDEVLRIEYKDHIKYGVKCVKFTDVSGEETMVFYMLNKQKNVFLMSKWITILKVSNKKLFTENYTEIINTILKRERHRKIHCDSHFIEGEIKYRLCRKENTNRMIKNKNDVNVVEDYLYSELCMVDQYAGASRWAPLKKHIKKIIKNDD